MSKKDFISLRDFSKYQLLDIISLAKEVKSDSQGLRDYMYGKHVGLLFEKPSLRTKTSFFIGAQQLGANSIYYDPEEVRLGKREEVRDVSRTLSQYLDAIVLRTFSHRNILEFAGFSSIPVINGLSDFCHPSQAIADILTIIELKQEVEGLKVAYIGDSNNVCNSLINAFSVLGGNFYIATPQECAFDQKIIQEAKNKFNQSNGSLTLGVSPQEAAEGADVLYTDVWSSMGSEKEAEQRKKIFQDFQINGKILKKAKSNCIVMHCLPAHRGQEIADEVIEGDNSVVFLQAANRLHAAKAILMFTCDK